MFVWNWSDRHKVTTPLEFMLSRQFSYIENILKHTHIHKITIWTCRDYFTNDKSIQYLHMLHVCSLCSIESARIYLESRQVTENRMRPDQPVRASSLSTLNTHQTKNMDANLHWTLARPLSVYFFCAYSNTLDPMG